jgi:hypothetical protein
VDESTLDESNLLIDTNKELKKQEEKKAMPITAILNGKLRFLPVVADLKWMISKRMLSECFLSVHGHTFPARLMLK